VHCFNQRRMLSTRLRKIGAFSLVLACTKPSPDTSGPGAVVVLTTSAQDGGTREGAPEEHTPAPAPNPAQAPWSNSSTEIWLTGSGGVGSEGAPLNAIRFEARRELLTTGQLQALSALKTAAPNATASNQLSYRLMIYDQDGSATSYRTPAATSVNAEVLDADSLRPFLSTFQCIGRFEPALMQQSSAEDAGVPNAPPADVASLPRVSSRQPGCFHQIPARKCDDMWLQLQIDEPGSYELRADSCDDFVNLRLWAPDDPNQQAAFSVEPPRCSYTQRFERAGTHLLLLKGNENNCLTDLVETPASSAGELSGVRFFSLRVLPPSLDGGAL
jgi:hypothetical protein